MKAEFQVTGETLRVRCTGSFGKSDMLGVVDAIAAVRAENPAVRKCLMDAGAAELRLDGIGQYFVGEYAAKQLAGLRISMVVPSGRIDKLLENSAYNRGLKFLLTASLSEAEAWLAG